MTFEKLVRDSYGSADSPYVTRKAKDDAEFLALLHAKLDEETGEFLKDETAEGKISEAADMLAVMDAIWTLKGVVRNELFAVSTSHPDDWHEFHEVEHELIYNLEDTVERVHFASGRESRSMTMASVGLLSALKLILNYYELAPADVLRAEQEKLIKKGGYRDRIVMRMEKEGVGVLRDS